MTAKETELVKAYKKYIDFLGNAYENVFAIASVHNYSCSEEDIKLGQELRANIIKLEAECISDKGKSLIQNLRTTIDKSV